MNVFELISFDARNGKTLLDLKKNAKNRTIKIEQLTNSRARQYAAILDESMIFSELLQKVEGACTQYAMFCKQ